MLECIEYREEKTLGQLPLLYGKFFISKLLKGQGLTVANTLRRVLLYEIAAIGITDVYIHGEVLGYPFHEFSSIPGIKESILEIIMNLQSVIWKLSPKPTEGESELPPRVGEAKPAMTRDQEGKLLVKQNLFPLIAKLHIPLTDEAYYETLKTSDNLQISGGGSLRDFEGTPRAGLGIPSGALRASGFPLGYPPEGELVANLESIKKIFYAKNLTLHSINETIEDHSLACLSGNPLRVTSGFPSGYSPEGNLAESSKARIAPDGRERLSEERLMRSQPIQIVYPEQYIAQFQSVSSGIANQNRPGYPKSIIFECIIDVIAQSQTLSNARLGVGSSAAFPKESFPQSAHRSVNNTLNGTIFPVKKVNYTIQSTSFGEEEIFFEIWTNGSIHPQKVLEEAINKVIFLFQKFL